MSLLVVGLGNPGRSYQYTRHNVGFRVIEVLADEYGVLLRKPFLRKYRLGKAELGGDNILLVQPLTFMNKSGEILPGILNKYHLSVDALIVIADTMDLPPGSVRLKRGGSSAGHRGLKNIVRILDCSDFLRFYIGIGRPGADTISHVLGEFSEEEKPKIENAIARAAAGIKMLSQNPVEQVMNEVNRRSPAR